MATSNKNFRVKHGLDVTGNASASSFVKLGGHSAQFLMADGSVMEGVGVNYNVTNDGSGAYLISGSSNPTLFFIRGHRYSINVNAVGHPFWIQTVPGGYSSEDVYNSGVTNNGTDNGTIVFEVPFDAPQLYYACEFHSSMAGSITVSDGVGGGEGGGSLEVSETPPTSPSEGDIWYNSQTGQTFVYYDSFWVENISGIAGPEGPTGPIGETGLVAQASEPGDTSTLWLDTDEDGVGIPLGGTAGQVLAKVDSGAFNTEWVDVYTPTEVDNLLDDKANLADPTFTAPGKSTATNTYTLSGTSIGATPRLHGDTVTSGLASLVVGDELVFPNVSTISMYRYVINEKTETSGSTNIMFIPATGYANGFMPSIDWAGGNQSGAINITVSSAAEVTISSTEIGHLDGTISSIQTQLDSKARIVDPTFTGTVSGVTKNHVGLGNVDNTSDANKPVSSATQTALNGKASINANWSMSNATSVTVNTGTPTTIASCSITTNGRPVLIIGTGDANPAAAGDWNYITIYRGESQIGKLIINQTSGASHNNPFGITTIDSPAAGTYTYSLRAYNGAGSITYGEIGNVQAPTIIAMELF